VQAAIWFFTDGYVIGGPADIKTRAEVIIADAQGSNCVPVPVVPQSLALTPPSATNFLPLDTTHSVLATLIGSDTLPMANYPITIDVTGVSGPQSFSGTTDGSGQFTINYTNTSAVAGSDTITAHVTFTVPVGLKFKLIDKQGIVLAGDPVTGTVQGSAQKNWVPAACGDGFINQDGELCDDGNLIDGDDCDSNCTPTGCGNGIPTAGELCDDGNLIDGDGCDSNCTPTGCGNGIPTAGELCDDGNQVNGDGCDNNCTTTACGNGVVTPPELCEDGNQVNGDGCEADCTLPRCGNGIVDPFDPADPDRPGESCDDGNQLGCDPLHPSRPVKGDSCSNSCQGLICKDPSKIRLVDRGLDQFKAHGVLVPMANAPINFSNGHVSLALTTPPATPPEQSGAGALVFETSLPPGAVGARSNGGFKYKNLDAKQNGGIYQLTATPTNYGTFKVTIISYGNLSAAESDMITHIWVGGVQWTVHALWRQTNTGWVFQHTLP
jgi:cysteine-rich repeat protein